MTEGPRPSEARLGIVVVNYGSAHLLAQNLASIDRTLLPPTTVVVVDNRTTDEERATVEELAAGHDWDVVTPPTNLGFGAGINRGVERALDAGCTVLLLLNPDVAIGWSAIQALRDAIAAADRPLIVCPRLTLPDGTTWFAGGQIDLSTGLTRSRPDHDQEGTNRWLTGACLMLDRSVWTELGGFDERYFLYWEDVELTRRAVALGIQLVVLHTATASHAVGATQGAGKSPLYCYYMCRNRLLFATAHVEPRVRLRWMWHAPRYAIRVLRRDGFRASVRRPRVIAAALRGTGAGILIAARSLTRPALRPAEHH